MIFGGEVRPENLQTVHPINWCYGTMLKNARFWGKVL